MAEMSEVSTRGGAAPGARGPDLPYSSQVQGRIAAVTAALVFTVGFAGFLFLGPPGGGTTAAKDVVDYYHSTGSVVTGMVFGYVQVAGCLLLIWFFNELRSRLADTMLTRVALTFAIVGSALIVAGTGIMLGPSGVRLFTGSSFAGGAFVGVPAAITAGQSGLWVLLFGGVYPIGAAIVLLSLAALRQQAALPRWLAIAGLVIGVLLVASLVGTPALLLAIWLLLVAATGFRSPVGALAR
jgi:hypothetical protein